MKEMCLKLWAVAFQVNFILAECAIRGAQETFGILASAKRKDFTMMEDEYCSGIMHF